jgi:protocatechuate 3,4-dioxygenase beta subunit
MVTDCIPSPLSRRRLLEISIAAGAALFLPPVVSVFAEPTVRVPTSKQGRGPFYPIDKPSDRDADLTVIQGKTGKAQGQVIYVMGQVMDVKGQPLPGAQVEIWQANVFGRYTHPNDRNPAPLDPNFEGYGLVVTDREGRYKFKTIKPASYPSGGGGARPPHIHFLITTGAHRFATQMYFAGEPLNEKDWLLGNIANKETLIAKPTAPTGDIEPDALIVVWDIVLQ